MVKKIVVIPDSYKGCLTSKEVATIIGKTLNEIFPDAKIVQIPVSDGGDGFVDSYLAAVGGEKITLKTKGPYMEEIDGFYGMIDEQTAIVEMAASAGLLLVKNKKNPCLTTTYGVGEIIKDAVARGAKKIILGLGGSATNDMGVGMANSLGVLFVDQNNTTFLPVGETLGDITDIFIDKVDPQILKTKFTTLCDVRNPLYGPNGAAFVYAKQKGASEIDIIKLDESMKKLADLLYKKFQFNANFVGAGAAGGMTVSAKLFLNSEIKSGINTFLELIKFQNIIQNADMIITGEGRFDSQSMTGKVIDGISQYAQSAQIPLYAIVGQTENLQKALIPKGLTKIIALTDYSQSIEDAITNAQVYLQKATFDLASTLENK
ncbi:MAG: glycerate kinase [Bacilli bacterium]